MNSSYTPSPETSPSTDKARKFAGEVTSRIGSQIWQWQEYLKIMSTGGVPEVEVASPKLTFPDYEGQLNKVYEYISQQKASSAIGAMKKVTQKENIAILKLVLEDSFLEEDDKETNKDVGTVAAAPDAIVGSGDEFDSQSESDELEGEDLDAKVEVASSNPDEEKNGGEKEVSNESQATKELIEKKLNIIAAIRAAFLTLKQTFPNVAGVYIENAYFNLNLGFPDENDPIDELIKLFNQNPLKVKVTPRQWADVYYILAKRAANEGNILLAFQNVNIALQYNSNHSEAIKLSEYCKIPPTEWAEIHFRLAVEAKEAGNKDQSLTHLFSALQYNCSHAQARSLWKEFNPRPETGDSDEEEVSLNSDDEYDWSCDEDQIEEAGQIPGIEDKNASEHEFVVIEKEGQEASITSTPISTPTPTTPYFGSSLMQWLPSTQQLTRILPGKEAKPSPTPTPRNNFA